MESSIATTDATVGELENQFLAVIQTPPINVKEAIAILRTVKVKNNDLTAEWTRLLQDTLIENGDATGLIVLLRAIASSRTDDLAFGETCVQLIQKASSDRLLAAQLKNAAFGKVSPVESFRRLDVLIALKPDVLCLDRAWGMGVVKKIDPFYAKLTIDFHGKPAHQMTFQYGAESLQLLDDNHLLARLHREPEVVEKMVNGQPDELVRLFLRSFGPMPVTRIEELLIKHCVITADNWKSFWDAARKRLKNDPQIEIPSKRTDPVVLRIQADRFRHVWRESLARERDINTILETVENHESRAGRPLNDEERQIVGERLAFAIKGAHNTDPAMYTRLALTIQRLNFGQPSADELRTHLWENSRFIEASGKLSARDLPLFVEYLMQDSAVAENMLLTRLPDLPYQMLCLIMDKLRQTASANLLIERCREFFVTPKTPLPILVWAIRNREIFAEWNIVTTYDLMLRCIVMMETKASGEELRLQNGLRQLFDNSKWFEAIFPQLELLQRQSLFERIQSSSAWDPSSQRSLIGRMLRLEPQLAERRKTAMASEPKAELRLTSWRSYSERQRQLKKLVEIEIPANSKDIAQARSYGDLRENFEYQAAKQQQGILLQRKQELETDLQQVRGTDFADTPTDAAGIGTSVTIMYQNRQEHCFNILGEWDRDETLEIISNKSGMAMALNGHKAGETAVIPDAETNTRTVKIVNIAPLSQIVREWARPLPEGA